MSRPWIIDAHFHIGKLGELFASELSADELLAKFDRLGIAKAVVSDQQAFEAGDRAPLTRLRDFYAKTNSRVRCLAAFHPGHAGQCIEAIQSAVGWPGLAGIKIHPSFHNTPAESELYTPAWKLAAEYDLTILAHSWSPSDYNPVQDLSLPERFENHVKNFPTVRFVLAHAGGRGDGRGDRSARRP